MSPERRAQWSAAKANAGHASAAAVAAWLNSGKELVSDKVLARMREAAAEELRTERAAAVRRIAVIDEELRTLLAGPMNGAHGRTSRRPIQPADDATAASASVATLVQQFVTEKPGDQASVIIEYVKSIRHRDEDANVHAALYKLTKPGGPLMKKGERGNYTFWPRGAQAPAQP